MFLIRSGEFMVAESNDNHSLVRSAEFVVFSVVLVFGTPARIIASACGDDGLEDLSIFCFNVSCSE